MKPLIVATVIMVLSVSQSQSAPIDGSWNAQFEGRTFIRLEIKTADGAVGGGLSLGNFEVDPQGAVRRAGAAPLKLTPIFGATRTGSTVTFFTKDESDTDQFELRVLDAVNADLHVLLNDEDRKEIAASGVPLPKPIRLRKVD